MDLSRVGRLYGHITVAATLYDGAPATVTAVDVALLPVGTTPATTTTWTPTAYSFGEAVVLIAGPDADPTGAVVAPDTREVWARVVDPGGEVVIGKVGRVTVY